MSIPEMHDAPSFLLRRRSAFLALVLAIPCFSTLRAADGLRLTDSGYFNLPGLDVMLADDFYPEGHQGGVSIILNGRRVATNGDLRLEPTPGQWSPVPVLLDRIVDPEANEIRARYAYPDPKRNRTGFNPIDYPDLEFTYTVRIRPEPAGAAFRLFVDLDEPLPPEWAGRVGFNWEFFPGFLYGHTFDLDGTTGLFPRQANGPGHVIADGSYQLQPLATGRRLGIAPETADQRVLISVVRGGDLELLDGRGEHTNGWFIVRSSIPAGATTSAVEWLVAPHAQSDWRHTPVIQTSQVGYHPDQPKFAMVEFDARDAPSGDITLWRIAADGSRTVAATARAADTLWDGAFLRCRHLKFDFTTVTAAGLYQVHYAGRTSTTFRIDPALYDRAVWQPTLETFLPVQMCHMRINDRYRVWHDFCHLDDARMAPVDHNHFDGYRQGPSTLTSYEPGDHVPGLDRGGWHDAGDHDLRVESQIRTVHGLALAWEHFRPTHDTTTIDQSTRLVELHEPDGQPDILQQIEHGLLTVVGGYESLGRLYRGIITPSLRQYILLGDPAAQSDNHPYIPPADGGAPPPVGQSGSPDDNWVFTEENPRRELETAAGLAAGSRALRDYNPDLSARALTAAVELWDRAAEENPGFRISAAAELLIATGDDRYAEFLRTHTDAIAKGFNVIGWVVGRTLPLIDDDAYRAALTAAAVAHSAETANLAAETPYGIPYRPAIWGAGWLVQAFGRQAYYLHRAWPDLFPDDYYLNALNFVLGCHPGDNPVSFVSGVGARSMTIAYGINRADESYIPGGIGSGTALIRPDFPELLEWPYLWQQTEYVLGYGTTDFLTLALAAQHELNR